MGTKLKGRYLMAKSANRNGKIFESIIIHCLDKCGFPVQTQVVLDVVDSIGSVIRVDFHVTTPKYTEGLYIEAKWQSVGGSADQKLPTVCENIKKYYPKPAILVADGKGLIKARRALKSQVEGNLLGVYSLREFIEFCLEQCDDNTKISVRKDFDSTQMLLPI